MSSYSAWCGLLRAIPDPKVPTTTNSNQHVAYILWKFPTSSETFIRREIEALTECGVKVSVISEYRPEDETDQKDLAPWIKTTRYMRPVSDGELLRTFRGVLRRRPLRTMHLCCHVLGRRYHEFKHYSYDRRVFLYTCLVSEVCRELGVGHVHSPWADLQAFITCGVAALLDIPYSLHARAHDIHRYNYRFGFREKFERAKFIVTNSQYNRSYLGNYLSKETVDRINVIYNGVPLHRFPVAERRHPHPEVRFICVARLIEEKGLLYLLAACGILKDHGVAFHLDIVGGPEKDRSDDYPALLKSKHRELGLGNLVCFTGPAPHREIVERLSRADIFVLPCVRAQDGSNDISPNALLEAMATAMPVISTVMTAIPEIVDNERNGLLVPPGDETALADAMQRLADSEFTRRSFGQAARRKIQERFDLAKNIQTYVRLFETRDPQQVTARDSTRRR